MKDDIERRFDKGLIGQLIGIPIFEDTSLPKGKYIFFDENNLPTKMKDITFKKSIKLVVHNYLDFMRAMRKH